MVIVTDNLSELQSALEIMSEAILIVLFVLALAALVIVLRRYVALNSEFQTAKTDFRALQSSFDSKLDLTFERWKQAEEQGFRDDAIERSRAVTIGKVAEHVVPHFPQFAYNPKDARFLGSPLDFVVFDGLDEGNLRQIVFVEVKIGSANLTANERNIQKTVHDKLVEFKEINIQT